jgi:SEC-C motif
MVRRSKPPEKTGRNDPCWCGSGKKYKHCCLRQLSWYLFDHPNLSDLWDTQAYDVDHAERNFRNAWSERTQAGGTHEKIVTELGAKFEQGKIVDEHETRVLRTWEERGDS